MKKIISIFLLLVSGVLLAKEPIYVVNAQGPTQSMTPQILAIVNEANKIQDKYHFMLEFKTGGFESIGVRNILDNSTNRIVTITNSVVEAESRGLVDLDKLSPVFSHGSACWAVITNFGDIDQGFDSLKNFSPKELVLGGPAIGGAAHLIGLEIGKKYNIPVEYIVYRSNADALISVVAGNNRVNMVVDRVINYQQHKLRNPNLQVLGVSCPQRHPSLPNVKTLIEQNIKAPYIFHFTMASTDMPAPLRIEINQILAAATQSLGQSKLFELGDFIAPNFYNVDTKTHYNESISLLKYFREKYKAEIQATGK